MCGCMVLEFFEAGGGKQISTPYAHTYILLRLWPLRFGCRQGHLQHSLGKAAALISCRFGRNSTAPAHRSSLAQSRASGALHLHRPRPAGLHCLLTLVTPRLDWARPSRAPSATVAPPARIGSRQPRRPRGKNSDRLYAPEAPDTSESALPPPPPRINCAAPGVRAPRHHPAPAKATPPRKSHIGRRGGSLLRAARTDLGTRAPM
jgi:hypothetical protein